MATETRKMRDAMLPLRDFHPGTTASLARKRA
jgi:hypothetical protein